jgi:hypothetical protein
LLKFSQKNRLTIQIEVSKPEAKTSDLFIKKKPQIDYVIHKIHDVTSNEQIANILNDKGWVDQKGDNWDAPRVDFYIKNDLKIEISKPIKQSISNVEIIGCAK